MSESPFPDQTMEEAETPGESFAKDALSGYSSDERLEGMNS
jgi:hypothetical protein